MLEERLLDDAFSLQHRLKKGARHMKLAQYLPNFRHEVTVKDLEVLAEELDFDSSWTLARIVVPEASDRGEREHSFDIVDLDAAVSTPRRTPHPGLGRRTSRLRPRRRPKLNSPSDGPARNSSFDRGPTAEVEATP